MYVQRYNTLGWTLRNWRGTSNKQNPKLYRKETLLMTTFAFLSVICYILFLRFRKLGVIVTLYVIGTRGRGHAVRLGSYYP